MSALSTIMTFPSKLGYDLQIWLGSLLYQSLVIHTTPVKISLYMVRPKHSRNVAGFPVIRRNYREMIRTMSCHVAPPDAPLIRSTGGVPHATPVK